MTDKEIISKYMSDLGRKGGKATLKKYGRKYYGKINGNKLKKINLVLSTYKAASREGQ